MKLTPRETEVLACLLEGKLNKQIAFELRLSESMVKVHLRRFYRKIGARHGREAMSAIVNRVAHAAMVAEIPTGHTLSTDLDIIQRIVDQLCAEQDNRPDSYSYEVLNVDNLRKLTNRNPLAEFMRYYDSLGSSPRLGDFMPETLRKFGGEIEPYHFIADVDLRTKDNNFSKFRYLSGGCPPPRAACAGSRRGFRGKAHRWSQEFVCEYETAS